MAIRIKTTRPLWLINQIKDRIDKGVIDTWSYDTDGDFTHVGQWRNRAWIRPHVVEDYVVFSIVGHKSVQMPLMDYAVFHGRFVELLLNQFPLESATLIVFTPHSDVRDFSNINIE